MVTPIGRCTGWAAAAVACACLLSACGDGSSPARTPTQGGSETRFSNLVGTATVELEIGTPFPTDGLNPDSLVFCEAITQEPDPNATTLTPKEQEQIPIAAVPFGESVVYQNGSCDADIDASGAVAVRSAAGVVSRITPRYAPHASVPLEYVIWRPAKGSLNGVVAAMTGLFLRNDATITIDVLGRTRVDLNMTTEGQEVFGTLSERNIGLPLTTFVNGAILRGSDGQPFAPTIQSRIRESILVGGLSLDDAKRVVAIVNSGGARG